MNPTVDAANTLGLQFSGSMTASISHELKNVLAIVNENGGLLGDLAMLVAKGRPLDPERLKTISGNIHRQVQRADVIIKRRFINQRLIPSFMEPRAVVAAPLGMTDEITVWSSTQISNRPDRETRPTRTVNLPGCG